MSLRVCDQHPLATFQAISHRSAVKNLAVRRLRSPAAGAVAPKSAPNAPPPPFFLYNHNSFARSSALMADNYIDQTETLGYGEFAAKQIKVLAVGVDPEFDDALHVIADRVAKATKAMSSALTKAGEITATTFTGAANAGNDPANDARDILSRVVKYAESRDNGEAIARDILNGESLTTIKRRRPAKLVHALDVALSAIKKHQASLPEYKKWAADLTAVRDALNTLDSTVRASRQNKRDMTPAVAAARDRWLVVYGGAKLIVEGVLRLNGVEGRMPDIFDDLAETHRVAGVSDDGPDQTAGEPKKEDPKPA
ncbi:MAG: hypothetical protein IPK82_42405 [Polyangiaceae bacterium]|nr:hypothetical protein [Polyangiaceae bacterium]